MEVSNEFLVLVYSVRKAIFSIFDRENEYAFYLMKLAKLYRKSGHDILKINKYFRECQKLSHKIVDFELEYAKYTLNIKNASEAY
ncbi:MAG: hypothetical protein FJX80_09160 [Bacteroidetes bacterium]|nr:hypothetical protein [Bacteroidota bacterium]